MQEFVKNLALVAATSTAGLGALIAPGCYESATTNQTYSPHFKQSLTISLLEKHENGTYELRSLDPKITLMFCPDVNETVGTTIAKQLDQIIRGGVKPGTKLLWNPFSITAICRGEELDLNPTRATYAVVDLLFKKQ